MVVIAISGKSGCGSSTTAELVAKRLELKFYSIGKYQKSFGKSDKESIRGMEAWEEKKDELSDFEHEKDELAKKLASEGNVVIEGKLAVHMIKNADIKIWLTASFEIRRDRYVKRDHLTFKDAEEMLRLKEEEERNVWKKVYGFDYFEQSQEADVVIDTGNKTPDVIADMIIEKLKEKKKD